MIIRPSIFLTADTHFGHSKTYTHWKQRFEGFEEMIVKDWNRVVNKKDIVLHLGDLTLCNKEKTQYYTSRLNGKKYLILGNHDSHSITWYRECGFTVIPACFWIYKDKYENYTKFLFTHIPVDPLPENWFNLHGHCHGNSHRGELPTIRHCDVGIDIFNKPIQLFEIIKYLNI